MNSDIENPGQSIQSGGRPSQVSQAPPTSSMQRSSMQASMQPKPDDPYASQQSRGAASSGVYSSRAAATAGVDPQTASNRFTVIMIGILIIICLGVAAIVLPFTLDSYCNCPQVPNISGPTVSPNQEPTTSPTVSPGTPTASPTLVGNPSERFVQFVNNFARDISGDEPFGDPDSPQYRAAAFIADDAEFTTTFTDVAQLGDLYAATVIYYSTKGDDWTKCSQGSNDCDGVSWLSTTQNQCEWHWITCNDAGRVVDIIFST